MRSLALPTWKPRNGVTLPSYRGDMINSIRFTEADRIPNPERLLRAYERAALTLNFIRSLVDGGLLIYIILNTGT